jgi:hypothetical protein
VHSFPLATEPVGFFGVLIFMVIALLFFGVMIAVTFGPIALVIAGIVRSLRTATATGSATTPAPPFGITMLSGTRVIALDQASPFAQAFGASLQRSLGGQLGQALAQLMTQAAAQHPLGLQLAPMVLAIETARRQGDLAAVRPFLTERFAARFRSPASGGPGGGLPAISHMALGEDAVVHGDQVVIRIDRGTAGPSEYWAFQRGPSAPPDGTPVACPRCGAPTAGDYGGTCRFCGAAFSTIGRTLPPPIRWLLDDISTTPPALAA